MVTRKPRTASILVALVFTLSSVLLTVYVWTRFGGTVPLASKGYEFNARFSNAADLVAGNDVRISGVDVGKVTAVRAVGGDTLATIQVKRRFAPIPADSRAILRIKTLLGEVFVDLSPGTASAPKLLDGGTLPSSQVAPTQPLDRVLSLLDARTQRNLNGLLGGISTGVSGQGAAAFNAALGTAEAATAQLDSLAQVLDGERGSVTGVVRDTGAVLRAVGARQAELRALVTAGDKVLSTTAARNRAVTSTVDALAPLLPQLRTTLDTVEHSLTLADPTLATLVPVAPLLAPTLTDLERVGPAARALLRQAGPLIDVARTTLPALGKATAAIGPALHAILPVGDQLAPEVALAQNYTPEVLATMGNVAALAAATSPGPSGAQQHYLRVVPVLGTDLPFGQPTRPPNNRHNAYHAPGEMSQLASGGLLASDCSGAGGSAGFSVIGVSAAAPCKVQPGWTFGGWTRYFPHVAAAPAPK
jgi:virulence factor Mce-like protein